jgi:serine/threonine-protein kinase RsbW
VIHGNHENANKHVEVICRCSMDGELLIIVRDEGDGFDCSAVPDPTEPERLFLASGRGLHLMRAMMDDVSFEENGTVVRMRKRLKSWGSTSIGTETYAKRGAGHFGAASR